MGVDESAEVSKAIASAAALNLLLQPERRRASSCIPVNTLTRIRRTGETDSGRSRRILGRYRTDGGTPSGRAPRVGTLTDKRSFGGIRTFTMLARLGPQGAVALGSLRCDRVLAGILPSSAPPTRRQPHDIVRLPSRGPWSCRRGVSQARSFRLARGLSPSQSALVEKSRLHAWLRASKRVAAGGVRFRCMARVSSELPSGRRNARGIRRANCGRLCVLLGLSFLGYVARARWAPPRLRRTGLIAD